MKCYVLTLRTDWGMILFSNIGEVVMSALCDCSILPIQKETQAGLGKAALRGCCVFSQGQDRMLWHCTLLGGCSASVQLLLLPDSSFPEESDPLEESSLKRDLNCWGQPEERTQPMAEPVPLLLPTPVHLQAGWELLQPCLQKQDPVHATIAAAFGSQAVTALLLSLAKAVQTQMLS